MRRPYAALCASLFSDASVFYAEPYAHKAGSKFAKPYAHKALHKAFSDKTPYAALCASWVSCAKSYASLMRNFLARNFIQYDTVGI